MNILLIVGSLRKGSFNKRVSLVAKEALEGKANVSYLDWHALPVLDADCNYPFEGEAERIRKEIGEADALWIFDPEYNGAVPGGLKNVLDIASLSYKKNDFASGSPLYGKPVAISGAGGKAATKFSREMLTTLLKRVGCKVLGVQAGFAVTPSAFNDDQWELDEAQRKEVFDEADAFLSFIKDIKEQK